MCGAPRSVPTGNGSVPGVGMARCGSGRLPTANPWVDSRRIERVTFSPDGRRLATSGWDGSVTLWDERTGRDVLCLRGHSDRVWGITYDHGGDVLVSAGADGKVLLWDAKPVRNSEMSR